MIIERIDLFKVPPRWMFLKITTKSGYTGWGEPVVEGKTDTVLSSARIWKDMGVHYLAYSVDVGIYFSACKTVVNEIQK